VGSAEWGKAEFPLTPALSLGEKEDRRPSLGLILGSGNFHCCLLSCGGSGSLMLLRGGRVNTRAILYYKDGKMGYNGVRPWTLHLTRIVGGR
jgi:hypothetical protein